MKLLQRVCHHAILLLGLVGALSGVAHAQNMCVFDWGGNAGDNVQLMKSYMLEAKGWGVNMTQTVYTDESLLLNDVQAGKCDGFVATAFVARHFNDYVASLSAVGAIPSNALAHTILALQSSPRLAPDMLQHGYEAAGVIPAGQVYIASHDKHCVTIEQARGKRYGVWALEPMFSRMAQEINAVPVPMTNLTLPALLKSNAIDGTILPVTAFQPLDIYHVLGSKGGVVHFPIMFLTFDLIIKPTSFPKGFGQKSREWFADQSSTIMSHLSTLEEQVPPQYWSEVPAENRVEYIKLERKMRLESMHNGEYNHKMLSLLKHLRCQQDPSSFECPLSGE